MEILNVTLKYTCILHVKCNLKFKRVYPLLHQVLAHAFINTDIQCTRYLERETLYDHSVH